MIRFIQSLLVVMFLFLSSSVAQNIKINEICPSNYISFEDSYDERGDWVEFYNAGNSSINMAGMYLTDNFANLTKFQIPANNSSATTIASHDHLIFWLDEEQYKGPTHTNFKLSNTGERIALVASDGVTIIDSISFGAITYDVTLGRTTDGSSSWSYFPVPTPDNNNSGGGYLEITGKANFVQFAGFYPSTIQVELTYPDPTASIYYSINGNEPSPTRGILYTGPITVNTTTAMRARVFKANYIPGEVTTSTYFINRPHDLPILSVVTDSLNLWDENTGIYCFGVDDYDHSYPYSGANFWEDWKKPAHIELFETSGGEVISQNLKLSISGNTSRAYAQKSLNFESEDALGKKNISYQIFPQLPITEYKSFKVRNGGSDWSSTGIRDAFNHTLLEGAMDVDHQSFRPVILYINGAYWGLIQMTEKIDEDYLNAHFPAIDKDSVDLLFSNAQVANGDANSYNAMINYIANNSMTQQSNYNFIKNQIDIPEYINYYESRIYYASTDWPYKNLYFWRPKDQSMKWRWIMWDTDRSTLLTTNANHPCNVNHNTLAWATTSSSNPPWSQFLINNLLLNSEFKSQFITQFAHHINFTFCPSRTDSVLNVFRNRLQNEMPAHIARWEYSNDTLDYYTAGYYHSLNQWNKEVDTIKLFYDNRANYMRKFIMQQFSIGDTSHLSLVKNPPQGGIVVIDTFKVPSNPCRLVYFDGYPVTLKAIANPGYVFAGWTSGGGNILPFNWVPNGDTTVTAYFTPSSATQPNLASSNYSATITGCTDIDLSWFSGNGSSRLVIARAASAVNALPLDLQGYVADAIFGNGSNLGGGNFVVYSGSGNSCTVTGLTAGETYYFAIIEFNGSSNTSDYYTTSYLTGNTIAASFTAYTAAISNTICQGSSTVITAGGGVTYQWSPSTGLSSLTGATVTASPNNTLTYTVIATDGNGCQAISKIKITVNPRPTVTLNNFSDVCLSSNQVTLTGGSPAGGVYSGTNVSSGSFNISAAGVGNHTIKYRYTNTYGCSDSASAQLKVLALPNVALSAFNSVCLNSSAFLLNGGTPSGGTYSGPGISGGSFNPATAGAGLHTVTYSVTNSSGCSGQSTSTIVVNANPNVSLNAYSNICLGASPIVLSGGTPSGGTYSGPGISGGSFNPATAGAGSHTVTYSVTNSSGCSGQSTSTILVNANPNVSLNAFSNICLSASPIVLSGGTPSGGTYSGQGISGGSFNPAAAGAGSHTVTYSVTNSSGCSGQSTSTILVDAIPNVALNAFSSTCLNASPIVLSGGTPSGGSYTGPGVSSGSFDPATAGVGTHTVTYSVTNSSGCSGQSASTILVNVNPTISLGIDTTICDFNSIQLDAGSGLSSYLWSTGETSQSIIADSAGHGLGTVSYSVTGTNAFGCTANDDINVTFDLCSYINSAPLQSSLLVFPNPFSDEITILISENNFTINMFDVLGNIVFSKRTNSTSAIIQPVVSAGVYFLQVVTANGSKTIKVVKTNGVN